ncbi:hypothetical protein M378DRAFT_17957 [Amanita muscaria Koide BX008]|uniref:Protein kinase domain-containing protein n=1 Tax=Amanita muscaria (strain Koide BX008) TaxID=946122 RepID=A0A0C2WFP9_AMAMK|nr:hypothetical protein M378DRAFT_17957 [Amanita muscaria Koide BX008]
MLAAHKYLWENLQILHRDISIGNILLYRAEEGQEANGLLIDFDFSTTFVPDSVNDEDDANFTTAADDAGTGNMETNNNSRASSMKAAGTGNMETVTADV